MRHLVAAGGLALAACVCGLLLSGAASAKQASDSITITGVLNGTTITFTVSSSPVSDISLFGGSNWHFTAASSAGGNCNLTPTNGGAFCSYASPVTSFTISTTITGTPPTEVVGQVGYADASTGQLTASVNAAPECRCAKLSAQLSHVNASLDRVIVFFSITTKLDCHVGTQGECNGEIKIKHSHLPGGMRLNYAHGVHWANGQTVTAYCTSNPCQATHENRREGYSLYGIPAVRADETIKFELTLHCSGKETKEELWLKFDSDGRLDRKGSHLGKLA